MIIKFILIEYLKEKDPIFRILDLIANFADQLFFPLEHIAWASDCGLIKIPSAKFWATSIGCWAVSLLSGILKLNYFVTCFVMFSLSKKYLQMS